MSLSSAEKWSGSIVFSAYPQRGLRLPYATFAIVTSVTLILQSSPSWTCVGDGGFYSWLRCSRTSLHYGVCSAFQAFGPHSVPRTGAILGPKYVSQFSSNDRSDICVEECASRHFVSDSRLFGTTKFWVGHHKVDSIVTEPIRQSVENGARPSSNNDPVPGVILLVGSAPSCARWTGAKVDRHRRVTIV